MSKKIVVEWCSHCEEENELMWDTETQGWEIFCPNCGEKLMLCDECLHSEDNPTQACSQEECKRKKIKNKN